MPKRHMKRISAPKTWPIDRKKNTFIKRPNPGAHTLSFGISLATAMTELIKCANTKKEIKSIIRNKNVLVDGRKRDDDKFMVGLMDTITIKETDEHYRIMISDKGKIKAVKISAADAGIKPSRIMGKTVIKKGLIQLNMIDGRNITLKKNEYKVGDTLMISLPEQKIISHLSLEPGVTAYFIGGKHLGETGKIEAIDGDNIKVSAGKGSYETLKEYAFVVGKEKPEISLADKK